MFDAYTVKKVLPRLAIAVVLIQLSWFLFTGAMQITTSVAYGIEGLMYAPFGGRQELGLAQLIQNTDGVTLFGVAAATATIGAFFLGGLLAIAGIVLVGLFTGFVVLLLRQVVLMALLILSPIALVLWILPNTEKYWKMWWDNFIKLLFMFPIILAMLAAGRIFAFIAAGTVDASDNINNIIGERLVSAADNIVVLGMVVLGVFGPFFLVPKTYQLAGSAFGSLSGMIRNAGRPVSGYLNKKRAETWKDRHTRAGENRLFNPNGRFGRLNTAAGWIATPGAAAKIKLGTRGGKAIAAEITQKSAQQSQDLAKWMSSAGFNQEALSAIMENVEQNGGKLSMSALKSQADFLAHGNTQERAAATQLRNAGNYLNNLSRSEEYGRANIGMAAGYAKGAQGFLASEDPEEIARYANFLNKQAPGLGDTFKTQAGLMNAQAGGLSKVGYSEQVDAQGNYVAGSPEARAIQMTRTSVQEMSGAKASQLKKHFADSGALATIMRANTANGREHHITDAVTGETVKVNTDKQKAIVDNLVQAAYGYNTPAETAAELRRQIETIKGDGNISDDLKEHLNKKETMAARDFSGVPAAERAALEEQARRAAEE